MNAMTEPMPRVSRVALPPEPESVRAARRLVRSVLSALTARRREHAELMVSELTANAVRHAGEEFTVVIDVRDSHVRVEVHDPEPALPNMRRPDVGDTSGRGLQIVSELADRWGTEPTDQGKTVWFELDG